ncbi:MAG: S-layer homology domain-containing protein, partial [Oscillospiraceae bacterium]|nr:S-layer homology domain-containing protein [Oscillospiraceae bacterium]
MWNQTNAVLRRLKDAYVYTSDIKYGRAGAILLDRIADIYPGYDIYPYADYFLNTHGGTDIGSLQGCINDTSFAKSFAEATDAFYPALSDPQLIKFLSERAEEYNLENDKSSSKLIWENWEANILEHIFKMAKQNRLTGNFGMLQGALSITAIALDKEPETTEMIEWIYQTGVADGTGNEKTLSGGNVASQLVDKVDRDGIGSESGPGYNFMWLSYIMEMGKYLAEYQGKADVNLYDNAKFIQMFIAPTRLVLTESHHVQVGDSGTTASLEFKSELATALEGFINIKDERVRKILAQYIYIVNGKTTEGINYGIFAKDPERAETELLAYIEEDSEPISEMLAGYGFAVLRDGKEYDSASSLTAKNNMRDFWMYFGNASSHKHFDALTFGMEAYGLNVAPDLGYPENTGTDPNRLQWVQATIAHNTVTVDERDQESDGQPNALPLHFDNTDAVKLMDVSAPDAYTQVDNYRRSIVMIKVDDDVSYGVDFFRVTGGQKHTYSFHSQAENAVATSGLELVADPVVQDKNGRDIVGSYAGPDVPFGQDPDTIDEWFYETRYPRGYTWMRRPRRDTDPSDNFSVEFDVRDYIGAISDGKDITLRMTQINNFTPDEVAIVAGYVPKRNANIKLPETIDYVLTQRYAQNGESLDSLFTTVFEPYKGERYIENIEAVEVSGNVPEGEMVRAIKVTHTNGDRIDYVIYATDNSETYTVKDTNGESVFTFRGFVGLYSLNADGAVLYRYVNDGDVIDGTGDESTGSISEYTGTVAGCTQQLSLDNYIDVNMQCNDLASLSGKYIYVDNDGKQNGVYRIDGAAQSPNGDGTIRLDIGMISPIRGHKNKEDVNAGYVYNIASEQTFRIPMSYSEDYSPIFATVNDSLTTSAGNSIKFKVSAESPVAENAPTIEYVGTTLPRGASLDSATGEITWKPASSQIGENHFAITARDSDGRESTVHFTITVYGSTTGGSSKEDNTSTDNSGSNGDSTTPSGGGGGGGGGGGAAPTPDKSDNTETDDNQTDNGGESGETGGNTDNTGTENGTLRFIDLNNHAWAADAINALAADGIIKGTSASTFSPAANITRADFALLLVRAFKLTSDNTENFADVSANDYFASELAIARNTGIVNGIGDNRFAPRNTITRQDMMVIVHRALQTLDVGLGVYDEPQNADYATVAEYAKPAVTALIGANLVNGKSGRIAPTDYTTRAEVAVLIKRILDFIK